MIWNNWTELMLQVGITAYSQEAIIDYEKSISNSRDQTVASVTNECRRLISHSYHKKLHRTKSQDQLFPSSCFHVSRY